MWINPSGDDDNWFYEQDDDLHGPLPLTHLWHWCVRGDLEPAWNQSLLMRCGRDGVDIALAIALAEAGFPLPFSGSDASTDSTGGTEKAMRVCAGSEELGGDVARLCWTPTPDIPRLVLSWMQLLIPGGVSREVWSQLQGYCLPSLE